MDSNTQTDMAAASSSSSHTQVLTEDQQQETPILRLNLRRPSGDKKVSWNTNTVDNEHMGKKKSKCCCIYKKQLAFGESSSDESEDECDHCYGHVEIKKKNSKKKNGDDSGGDAGDEGGNSRDGSTYHSPACTLGSS